MMATSCTRTACSVARLKSSIKLFSSERFIHASSTAFHPNDEVRSSAEENENFRVYEIEGLSKKRVERGRRRVLRKPDPPRFRRMATDQDWTDVWPTAETFKWSAVPFPVRQGYVDNSSENQGVIPSKYANLELMKGPNFLHLTPAHIKKHCQALKKFCSEWPTGLETDEQCRLHFPLESITSDYVFASPSITDPRARTATLKFFLEDLELDAHAEDKFIRLVGHYYDKDTGVVTLESDRCPLKYQNLDFLKYVLTALYFESWKVESWEKLKELSDMEKYVWDMNSSREKAVSLLKTIKAVDDASESEESKLAYLPSDVSDEDSLCNLPEVQDYKVALEDIFNEGENIETLNNYKKSVKVLLNIQSNDV